MTDRELLVECLVFLKGLQGLYTAGNIAILQGKDELIDSLEAHLNEPPPLGVSVSDGVQSIDRMG